MLAKEAVRILFLLFSLCLINYAIGYRFYEVSFSIWVFFSITLFYARSAFMRVVHYIRSIEEFNLTI